MAASHSLLTSRAACIAACVFAFFITISFTCGQNAISMLAVLGTDGVCAGLWIAGACALGVVVLNIFRVRTNPLLLLATAGGLGLGIFGLAGLFLGLAGLLDRPVALAMPIASVAMWIITLLRRPGAIGQQIDFAPARRWLAAPAGFAWVWIIPVISLAMVCVSASLLPGVFWKPFDPAPYDVTSYHFQVPREWYEAGRIVPLRHNMFSYFPFNVEMQFLLLMHVMGGPWAGMYACQFLCVGYSVLMVVAVAGAASEGNENEHRTLNVEHRTSKESGERSTLDFQRSTFKGGPSSLQSSTFDVRRSMFAFSLIPVIGAAFVSVVPWVLMLAGVGYVEAALMLYTTLAITWAMRAMSHTSTIRTLILAGVMAGFAAGVKITALPMLLLAVPAATFVVLMIRRPVEMPIRRLLLGCAAFVIAGSIAVSPWLIRNWIWTGNPVWPLAMNTLGRDHFTPDQVARFTKAHSPRDDQRPAPARVAVLWRDVLADWQFGYVLLPVSLLAARLHWRDRQTWLLLLTAVIVLVVWIGFTHLLARFLVMLIPIAGIAIGRIRWGRFWPAGIIAVLFAATCGWFYFIPELMKQSAAPDQPLFGIVDLTGFLSTELLEAKDKHMQVGLVGDAQAFFYQIPMTHLHYRTVFDVPGDVTDPVEAWAGKTAVGNPNYWLVINTSEIDRLHRTYAYVPALPEKWRARSPETFFIRGDCIGP